MKNPFECSSCNREKDRHFITGVLAAQPGRFARGERFGLRWNPSTPRFTPEPFSGRHPELCRRGKMAEKIVHITDDTFESEVLQSQTPVLVDYWAEWCGPCKMIAPALDQIAKEYEGRLKVAKLNIDENPVTPPKYSVRGIPTLMLFKNGSLEAQKVGALSKTQLAAFIDSNI